jgi:hypothetical protein
LTDFFDERFAALAAVPRDRGLPARSSSASAAGALLRRARVLPADRRPEGLRAVDVRLLVVFPLERFAPVLFAFVRRAM